MSIQMQESREGEVLVVRLDGRLDAASAPQLEQKMQGFIDGGDHQLVLVFSKVDYLSSAGLRLLLSLTKKLTAAGGKMVVAAARSEVREVIKMAGFDHLLKLAETEKDALAAFKLG